MQDPQRALAGRQIGPCRARSARTPPMCKRAVCIMVTAVGNSGQISASGSKSASTIANTKEAFAHEIQRQDLERRSPFGQVVHGLKAFNHLRQLGNNQKRNGAERATGIEICCQLLCRFKSDGKCRTHTPTGYLRELLDKSIRFKCESKIVASLFCGLASTCSADLKSETLFDREVAYTGYMHTSAIRITTPNTDCVLV